MKKIKGNRELTDLEVDLINKVRVKAQEVGELIHELSRTGYYGSEEPYGGPDQRWVAIGRTDIQKGFMALVRAVAQQESF